MDIYKMLYPFNTVKKVPHESTPMRCIRVCEKFVLFVILHSFCWIGLSPNIIIIVNDKQLSTNWTWIIHNYVHGAHISLCELNLTFQNLVWNIFYTLAIRNDFSFHKLVISIFEHFLKISHNFRIINSQNISSDEKTRTVDTLAKLFQAWEVDLVVDHDYQTAY